MIFTACFMGFVCLRSITLIVTQLTISVVPWCVTESTCQLPPLDRSKAIATKHVLGDGKKPPNKRAILTNGPRAPSAKPVKLMRKESEAGPEKLHFFKLFSLAQFLIGASAILRG